MGSLRTKETQARYKKHLANGVLEEGCVLCRLEPLKEFKYWKVVKNEFPYDKVAKTHHMVVPLRHAVEKDLNEEEKKEYLSVKKTYLFPNYGFIVEANTRLQSIPDHFHLHLITIKDALLT